MAHLARDNLAHRVNDLPARLGHFNPALTPNLVNGFRGHIVIVAKSIRRTIGLQRQAFGPYNFLRHRVSPTRDKANMDIPDDRSMILTNCPDMKTKILRGMRWNR